MGLSAKPKEMLSLHTHTHLISLSNLLQQGDVEGRIACKVRKRSGSRRTGLLSRS